MSLLDYWRGTGATPPPRATLRHIALTFLGCVIAIGTVVALSKTLTTTLLLGSFGGTCVLVFGFPEAAFSQPRNVVFGHLLCTLVGLTFLHSFGPSAVSMTLAVATAAALMLLLGVVHPPAGGNVVISFLGKAAWSFALFPTLAGVLLIVTAALLYHGAVRHVRYPRYW